MSGTRKGKRSRIIKHQFKVEMLLKAYSFLLKNLSEDIKVYKA